MVSLNYNVVAFGFASVLGLMCINIDVGSSQSLYPRMQCGWTAENGWDADQRIDLQHDFLSGQSSHHNNNREDRKYKWKYCRVFDSPNNIQKGGDIVLANTEYDTMWSRGCGGNTALNFVFSHHDNNREDRWFGFRCSQINSKYKLDSCQWNSNWINDWDGAANYQCPNNGLIRTVQSYHDNGKEDRRWKFECCRLAYSDFDESKLTAMECQEPNYYENDWDAGMTIVPRGDFFNGIHSVHDNHREDRRFRFRRCRPRDSVGNNAYTNTAKLAITPYDQEWTRSCSSKNNGNSAIVGMASHHNNNREDRQFTVTCGNLDSSKYQLKNCGWTGDLSNYDWLNNFDCPGNGVIRSIWSKHANNREDRLFKFECCSVVRN